MSTLRTKKRKTKYTLESGRTYVHRKCGQCTQVTGHDFANVCNPFVPAAGTICSACQQGDQFANFKWADTEEKLSDFRKRMREGAPTYLKYHLAIASGVGTLFIMIGMIIAALGNQKPVTPGLILFSIPLGFVLGFLFISNLLVTTGIGDRFYSSR